MGEIFLALYVVLPAAIWFLLFFQGIRYFVWSLPSSRQRVARGVALGVIHTLMAIGAVSYLVNQALHADELSGLLFIPTILAISGVAIVTNLMLLLVLLGRMPTETS